MQNMYHIHCPYKINGKPCKGELLADGHAKITVSVKCGKCGHVYYADLYTFRTCAGKPQRRVGRR